MDVGRFIRRKTELWAWLAGPVLVIWLLHAGILLFHLIGESRLAGLEAHADIVPRLAGTLVRVDRHIEAFHRLGDQPAEAMQRATRILDNAEKESGFVINSVRAENPAPAPQGGLKSIQVSVIGTGNLAEIVRFLGIVQQPVYLIDVEKADLNVMARERGTIYSARFLFQCYNAHSGS